MLFRPTILPLRSGPPTVAGRFFLRGWELIVAVRAKSDPAPFAKDAKGCGTRPLLRHVQLPMPASTSLMVYRRISYCYSNYHSARRLAGAQTELYLWIDGIGMTNVMPSHPPAHQVSFMLQRNQFALKLSFEKYPGEKGVSATNVLPMGWTSISARGQLDSSSTIGFTECVGGGADIRPLLLLAPRSLCLLACNSFNPQPLNYNLTNSNGCGNL